MKSNAIATALAVTSHLSSGSIVGGGRQPHITEIEERKIHDKSVQKAADKDPGRNGKTGDHRE